MDTPSRSLRPRWSRLSPLALTLLVGSSNLPAQTPVLVKDIYTSPGVLASSPTIQRVGEGNVYVDKMLQVGPWTYFYATDATNGKELYRTLGTAASTQLVKDIYPGTGSSSVNYLTAVGSSIYFVANDGTNGTELWVTDGTSAGTMLVKDIYPGASSSSPTYLCAMGGKLYFVANDGTNGTELWVSDGTAAGTVMLADINPGAGLSGSPAYLCANAAGTRIFFRANDGTNGIEPWVSDGTTTFMLADLYTGTSSSNPLYFYAYGGDVLFQASSSTTGIELFKSDGTAAGTVLVADIYAGTSSSSASLQYAVTMGGKVYFTATNTGIGNELWVTDGTTAGTSLVKDIYPGASSSSPLYLTLDSTATGFYFSALDSTTTTGTGREVWHSDGTAAGTVLVADIYPSTSSSSPQYFVNYGGKTYFRATDAANGIELWVTDGTAAGTTLVRDIYPGTSSSSPLYMTAVPGGFIFSANDGSPASTELWKSDGTTAGTALLNDINQAAGSASPNYFCNLNGKVYFSATDEVNGRELWVTDGTAAGTMMVVDLYPGATGSSPAYLEELNGKIYFYATTAATGYELFETDGTAAGTKLFVDIYPGTSSSSPSYLKRIGSKIYFRASDGTTAPASGSELWETDGTVAGTKLLKDCYPGTSSGSPIYFAELPGGRFVFSASDGTTAPATGTELWISDGTTAGTMPLADIYPGTSSSSPTYMTAWNGKVYFRANDGTNGIEPWVTDGTAAGTVMLKDINPGSLSSSPFAFAGLRSKLYFEATSTNGAEMWETDGTTAGTQELIDLWPGPTSSFPGYFRAIGTRHVYFSADDGSGKGDEIWKSDGTVAGTVQLPDINPGPASSLGGAISQGYRLGMHQAGSRMYFYATEVSTGVELYTLDNGATAWQVEPGCGTATRVPELWVTDPVLGKVCTATHTNLYLGGVGALVLGIQNPTPFSLGSGCFIHTDITQFWLVLEAWVAITSTHSTNFLIPNDPAIKGAEIGMQGWVLLTDAPLTFDMTNGVFAVVGN